MTTTHLFILLAAAALAAPPTAAAQGGSPNPRSRPTVGQPLAMPAPPVATPALPTSPPACCEIAEIAGSTVTARDLATGGTFRFRVTNGAVLRALAVGGAVWADPSSGRAGVQPGGLCCAILVERPGAGGAGRGGSGLGAAPSAGAGREGAPPPGSPPAAPAADAEALALDPRIRPIAPDPGYRLLKRTPIPFRAFAASDLGPGASPDRLITLPGPTEGRRGTERKVTVAAYLSQINALEKGLNEIGHSLRDMPDTPETALVLEEPVIGRGELRRQGSAVAGSHLRRGRPVEVQAAAAAFQARVPRVDPSLAAANRTNLLQSLEEIAAAPAALGGTASVQNGFRKEWGLPIGDPNSMWVSLDGHFLLDGNAAGTTMEIRQRARASVLQNELELLRMTGELASPLAEPMTASIELRVLGNSISLLDEKSLEVISVDGTRSMPIDWNDLNPFNVGGIPMSVEIEVRGESGAQFYAALYPAAVTGVVTPFASVTAGADIKAIDLEVVEAGVRGELVIVDDRLVLAGNASLQYDSAVGQPYLYFDYLGVNDFEALQGDLHLYACAYVISNWQPKKKCWRKYFWNEDGIDVHDELFAGSEKVYLSD